MADGAIGWGIAMATDIAFALGVLALLGDRVPTSLKVFLAALAIADDLGAVLVIAFFYTEQISWISLGLAGLFFVALIPWNKHFIMPVFALANAGVILGAGAAHSLMDPISLGVICGLVFGKPIGIVLFSWLATRSRIASMLDGVSWRQVVGVGMLGGIGFTMSLFIANLAFGDAPLIETAKVGILAASVTSAIAGAVILIKGDRHRGAPLPLTTSGHGTKV